MIVTRRINLKDGYAEATSGDPKSALEGVVGIAGDPPKWWQFWLPAWPKDAVAEYHRQHLPEPRIIPIQDEEGECGHVCHIEGNTQGRSYCPKCGEGLTEPVAEEGECEHE